MTPATRPALPRLFLNLLNDSACWLRAGKPVVDDATHAARRAACSPSCDQYDPAADLCRACGCPLHATAIGDKLRRATSGCPHPVKPRWLPMVGCDGQPLPAEAVPR